AMRWRPASELRAGMLVGLPNVRPVVVRAPEPQPVLAPRMHIDMAAFQLSITELQALIEKELIENPFLELKENSSVEPLIVEAAVSNRHTVEVHPSDWDECWNSFAWPQTLLAPEVEH